MTINQEIGGYDSRSLLMKKKGKRERGGKPGCGEEVRDRSGTTVTHGLILLLLLYNSYHTVDL